MLDFAFARAVVDTVGHVLTHIARNGDSFTRMMSAAIKGDVVTQYEGGHAQRSADIAAGADMPGEIAF